MLDLTDKQEGYSTKEEDKTIDKVIITDIKMSFLSMVIFMVKWALAAIPAFIILAMLFGAVINSIVR